jgi:hypothetical protein
MWRSADFSGISIKSLDGSIIEQVEDFKFLSSWIRNTRSDIKIRIGQAWTAATKLRGVWKSCLTLDLKRRFFQTLIVSILLYGCETWSLTKALEKILDGAYTKLLRYISGVSWTDFISNSILYGNLPRISALIQYRRLRFAGHYLRTKNQVIRHLSFRQPSHKDYRIGGGAVITYPKLILLDLKSIGKTDEDIDLETITALAQDRNTWKKYLPTLQTK